MRTQRSWRFSAFLLLIVLFVSACAAPAAAPAAESAVDGAAEQPVPNPADQASSPSTGEIAVPDIVEGKFNIAFVYVGPIGDGGWTYAHNQGREYILETLGDSVHTAYLESVPEGADSERVIRNLARKGFDAIFTTSFGYMDPTALVAEEFPDINFVHVSGVKKNDTNFANLFGAMENMKYLAGMIAGARAQADGNLRVGYVAPFPIAEVLRHANAAALGMRQTCPDCVMDIRWIYTWFDPQIERDAAQSLIEAGAGVVITGADTPGPVQVAGENGLYGIGYDSNNACEVDPDHCLTTPYWNWGPIYVQMIEEMKAGTWTPGDLYFETDSGALGLLGFMESEEIPPGVPEEVVQPVRELLDQMLAGEFDRFDVFSGPIYNNKGELIVPEGSALTQSDLEGIDQALGAELGREGCTICMNWLAEGIVPEAEIPQ